MGRDDIEGEVNVDPRMKMGRVRRLTRRLLVLCAAGLICAAVSPWRLPSLPASVANADQVSPLAAPPPDTPDPLPLDEEALSWVGSALIMLSGRPDPGEGPMLADANGPIPAGTRGRVACPATAAGGSIEAGSRHDPPPFCPARARAAGRSTREARFR